MEGATLNLLTNFQFTGGSAAAPGSNDLRFVNAATNLLVGGTNPTQGGLGILPWATVTSFLGTGSERHDLVSDSGAIAVVMHL